jgi:hypothetical protein
MSIIHGMPWSKDVIKRKDRDQSSGIIYAVMFEVPVMRAGTYGLEAASENLGGRLQRTDPGLPNDPRQRRFFVVWL